MKASEFREIIDKDFESLYDFMESLQGYYSDNDEIKAYKILHDNQIIFISNQDEDVSDSYNFTDEDLKRVYQHVPSGNYFMVEGKNQSYSGTNWNRIKDVNIKTNTITTYE